MHKLGVKDSFEKINRQQNHFKFQIWNIPTGKTVLLFTRTTQKAVFHLLFQAITFPAKLMIPKRSLILYHVLKSGFIEMLDTKFKTVFFCFSFFFPIQESIIFSRLKVIRKRSRETLTKAQTKLFL